MDALELNRWVIIPALERIGLYSESAANLLVGTVAHESHMGRWFRQVNGPALGIYQIEPDTIDDIYINFLKYRPSLRISVDELMTSAFGRYESAVSNLAFATALARLVYYRAPDALPAHNDVEGMAAYWKQHYNTVLGKGTEEQFINAFPVEVIQ